MTTENKEAEKIKVTYHVKITKSWIKKEMSTVYKDETPKEVEKEMSEDFIDCKADDINEKDLIKLLFKIDK